MQLKAIFYYIYFFYFFSIYLLYFKMYCELHLLYNQTNSNDYPLKQVEISIYLYLKSSSKVEYYQFIQRIMNSFPFVSTVTNYFYENFSLG